MSISLEELQSLVAQWYQVAPSEIECEPGTVPNWLNPILREFYIRFGALADGNSSFRHPASHFGPLSAQDHVVPVDKLNSEDGRTVFCLENQNVFAIAGSNDPSDPQTYAEGDAIIDFGTTPMISVGVPLVECIVTMVLRETILSVGDRYALIDPDRLDVAFEEAKKGRLIRSRYIWPEEYAEFYLSENIWFVKLGDMRFAAHRGLWRQAPADAQEIVLDGGGRIISHRKVAPTIVEPIAGKPVSTEQYMPHEAYKGSFLARLGAAIARWLYR